MSMPDHINSHFGYRTHLPPRCQAAPEATPLRPEWHNLVHRNYYGRRRLQIMDLHNDQQSMLRDFLLISRSDSPNIMDRVRWPSRGPGSATNWPKMHDYLRRREMPKHLHIAPESVVDMGAYRALVTPYYKNGNILEFINKQAVSDARKLQLVSDIR